MVMPYGLPAASVKFLPAGQGGILIMAMPWGSSMAPPYLCQVSTQVSCGACCGLYNVHSLSRAGLEALLATRTEAFARVLRQPGAIEDFGRKQLGWTPEERPFPHFHHCPYLGLIGREHTRVGCLLHPDAAGNGGRDWRELSYYGAKACRTYFCPTRRLLSAEHQRIIRASIDHWYLYGLAVTEHRLWAALFEALEMRIDRRVTPADFTDTPEAQASLRGLAALKLDWPYRRDNTPGPCHFFFDNERYPRPPVERKDPAIPVSPYEVIFQELESRFKHVGELRRAETMVERCIENLVANLRE